MSFIESKHLAKAFILEKTALANSYSKINLSKKLKKYPLGLNLCNTCGHLQLIILLNLKKCLAIIFIKLILYKNYLHFKNYANEIKNLQKKVEKY